MFRKGWRIDWGLERGGGEVLGYRFWKVCFFVSSCVARKGWEGSRDALECRYL